MSFFFDTTEKILRFIFPILPKTLNNKEYNNNKTE